MDRIDVQPLSAASAERLDRLFRLYSGRVLAFALTQAKRPEDAHDIAGETWCRVVADIHQLRADDAHAFGWLRTITFRAAVHHYRPKRASEQPKDWSDAVAVRELPAAPPADVDLYALAELTATQAAAVKLAAQGVSQRAIARRLGRKQQHVCTSIHAGARRLRAVSETKPSLPMRPTPHERDGRQPEPQPARPHSRALAAMAGVVA
ncbi:RNA polymerase sigma factor [Streptomyces sp. BRA346]|uniref:RNA polymerase sigma factor n=1 Tax=Streptomyces sp. BRA346 TaxID=2878199 RepID=UPI0040637B95